MPVFVPESMCVAQCGSVCMRACVSASGVVLGVVLKACAYLRASELASGGGDK